MVDAWATAAVLVSAAYHPGVRQCPLRRSKTGATKGTYPRAAHPGTVPRPVPYCSIGLETLIVLGSGRIPGALSTSTEIGRPSGPSQSTKPAAGFAVTPFDK